MKQIFLFFFILIVFVSNAQKVDLSEFMTDTTVECTYNIERSEIDSNCVYRFYIDTKIKKDIDDISITQGSGNAVLFPNRIENENVIFRINFYSGLCSDLTLHKRALYNISYNYKGKRYKKRIIIILW